MPQGILRSGVGRLQGCQELPEASLPLLWITVEDQGLDQMVAWGGCPPEPLSPGRPAFGGGGAGGDQLGPHPMNGCYSSHLFFTFPRILWRCVSTSSCPRDLEILGASISIPFSSTKSLRYFRVLRSGRPTAASSANGPSKSPPRSREPHRAPLSLLPTRCKARNLSQG